MKVYSQVQHWHLFVDTRWKGKMCALALAKSVLPKAFKGTARPYGDKPQRQWEHSFSYLEKVHGAETRLLPQRTLVKVLKPRLPKPQILFSIIL